MLHMIRLWFQGWTTEGIWLFVADVLIVLLILREDVWKLHAWNRRHRRIKAIFGCISQGQSLQMAVPSGRDDEAKAEDWNESVDIWNRDTHALLKAYSPQAAASFVYQTGRPMMSYGGVKLTAQEHYRGLEERLLNLRSIMEKPDVYF